MSRNIGNSILASSDPSILVPIKFKDATLTVVPCDESDTHTLILKTAEGECELASHQNGYSCHELARRMIDGDMKRTLDQAQYVIRCGGAADIEAIRNVVNRLWAES